MKATGQPGFKLFNTSCFYVAHENDHKNWNEAEFVCVLAKGNLATVADTETLQFLQMTW